MSIRRWVRRSRGTIAGLGLGALLLGWAAWWACPGPVRTWTERDRQPTLSDTIEFSEDGRYLMAQIGAETVVTIDDLAAGTRRQIDPPETRANAPDRWGDCSFRLIGGHHVLGTLTERNLGEGPSIPIGSPRNDWLAIWDAATGREVVRLPRAGKVDREIEHQVSDDGSTLIVVEPGTDSSKLLIWQAGMNRPPFELPGRPPMALSGNGRYAAALRPGGSGPDAGSFVDIWEVAGGRRVGSVAVGPPTDARTIALPPNGRRLVENLGSGCVIHDLVDPLKAEPLASGSWTRPRFSTDGTLLHLGQAGELDEVYDVSGSPARSIFRSRAGLISRDGRRILLTPGPEDDEVTLSLRKERLQAKVVDLPSLREMGIHRRGSSEVPSFRPDGRRLIMHVRRFDREFRSYLFDLLPASIRPRRPRVRLACETQLIDVDTGRVVRSVDHPDQDAETMQAALSPDGRSLAFFHREYGAASGEAIATLELWDARPRTFPWAVVVPAVGLLVVAGVGYDRKSRVKESRIGIDQGENR